MTSIPKRLSENGDWLPNAVVHVSCRHEKKGACRLFRIGWAVLLAALAGCGSQPYGTTAIRGKLTYEDGSLIPSPAITIYFEPQQESVDSKTFPRRGFAEVNVADGTFARATTYEPGDGVIVGPHKVVIEAIGEGGVPDYRYFPRIYSDVATTPLTIEVDGKQELNLTVPKP